MKRLFLLLLPIATLAAGCGAEQSAHSANLSGSKPEDLCVYIEQPEFYRPGPGMVSFETGGKYYSCKSQAALAEFKNIKGIKQ